MKLSDINPFVRFARVQENKMPSSTTVAPDHRIFYCTSGNIDITVENSVFHMKKGSLIFWRAGMHYSVADNGSEYVLPGCNFDFFQNDKYPSYPISYIKKDYFSKDMILEKNLPEKLPSLPDCLFLEYAPLEDKFEEIVKEYKLKKIFYEERCSCLLKDILICAARLYKTNEKENTKTGQILTYIHNHFSENITNAQIANHFSYHPNHINSLIKTETGVSLHRYLLEYRIHMAIVYLQSGDLNVTEVASLVGFNDVKHFSKCFKKITGNTPSMHKMIEKRL